MPTGWNLPASVALPPPGKFKKSATVEVRQRIRDNDEPTVGLEKNPLKRETIDDPIHHEDVRPDAVCRPGGVCRAAPGRRRSPMAVGGQATARYGSPVAVVRVRVVVDGVNYMMDPVKVQKGGPPAPFSKVVGNVKISGNVRWKIGPTVNVTAHALTPKGPARASNTLTIKTN